MGPETSWNSIFHLSDSVSLSVCFMYYTTSPRKGLQQCPRSKRTWKGDSGVSPEALEVLVLPSYSPSRATLPRSPRPPRLLLLEVLVLPSYSSKSSSSAATPPRSLRPSQLLLLLRCPSPATSRPAHTTLKPNCSSPLEEIQFARTVVADVHKESSLFQDPSLTTVYTHIGFHHLPAPYPPQPGGFTVMEP